MMSAMSGFDGGRQTGLIGNRPLYRIEAAESVGRDAWAERIIVHQDTDV